MNARKGHILIGSAGILLLAGIAVLTIKLVFPSNGSDLKYSEENFILKDSLASRQYLECDSMDEMDKSAFDQFLAYPEAPVEYELSYVALPRNLTYYVNDKGTLTEAFTLKKGTMVRAYPLEKGRGCQLFPTFEKEWCYGKPFLVEGEEQDEGYYYVRIKDLEKEIFLYFKESGKTAQLKKETGYSARKYARLLVRAVDRIFYERGVYCSRNIKELN